MNFKMCTVNPWATAKTLKSDKSNSSIEEIKQNYKKDQLTQNKGNNSPCHPK